MGQKRKRWNRWEKDEEKLRKLREKLQKKQEHLRHASEGNEEKPKTKLNREKIADLIVKHLREDPKVKKLAEELAQRVIIRMLPKIAELVISQMVKVIHDAVLNGAKVEIRGLATWKTKKGKIKVKNHIKPTNQP
jgi:nucleoid DNA-binding protein